MDREQGWRRFIDNERRELEARKDGQLARLLMLVLPGESGEHLQHLVEEERRCAASGLVELREHGATYHKHIDELLPEDVPARLEAESARIAWLTERTRRILEETRQRYHRRA